MTATRRPSWRILAALLGLAFLTLAATSTEEPPPGGSSPSPPYSIHPRPCTVGPRTGVCMFVWECVKKDGKHLGMCKEGFMFGSCCGHDQEENSVEEGGSSPMGVKPPPSLFGDKPPPSLFGDKPSTTTMGEKTTTMAPVKAKPTPPRFPSTTTTTTELSTTTSTTTEVPPTPLRPTATPSWSTYYTQRPFSNYTERPPLIWHTTPTTSTTTKTTTTVPPTLTFINPSTPTKTATLTFINPSTPTSPPPLLEQIDKSVGCGRAPLTPTSRIVGGQESPFASWPWLTSIRRTSFFGFSSTHRCGGALINEEWVATAGHCVDDLLTTQIRVRLGEWDFSSVDEKYPHVERGIKRKVVHPSYNFFTYESDLALLQLDSPLPPSPHIVPLCLPGNNDLLIGENATVAGWGRLSEGGALPNRLQQVQVPIISNEECRGLFLKSGRVEHIPEIFLCAGYEGGGRDSCQGDSGGPLQVKGADGRWFLGGVISWGIGCAEANMPGVCTRVSKFREWILGEVGRNPTSRG